MEDSLQPVSQEPDTASVTTKPARWKRYARWLAALLLLSAVCTSYLLEDHIRTLRSLRRVPGTNAYVMDYYVDYHIDQIRARGMDVDHIEDGLIEVLFPDAVVSFAESIKGHFLDEKIETIPVQGEHCSTITLALKMATCCSAETWITRTMLASSCACTAVTNSSRFQCLTCIT